MEDMLTTEYDGCGKCFVGARRLSRKTDKTNSPEKQQNHTVSASDEVGGHIIAWADDLESVSGSTDPMWRSGLGPWLRGEMGPYDGIVSSTVDRIGRDVHDSLNVKALLVSQGKKIVTYCHPGKLWDFSEPTAENEWITKAWLAQMELRMIQQRNRDETLRARAAGQPKQKPSYGYRYVRLVPTGKVDHVAIDPVAAEIIRDVAERILTDETGKITCATEAARLTREGVPAPSDHRAIMYGRKPKGSPWTAKTVQSILTSEAALGYLMHGGRPVLETSGERKGRPMRLADPLWDAATRSALVAKTAPKRAGSKAPKGVNLLSGLAFCGTCGARLYVAGRSGPTMAYGCTARVRGIPASQNCKPAPSTFIPTLDALVTDRFLDTYGDGQIYRRVYDAGTGYAARIKELRADRARLRADRSAGLYDDADDAAWYVEEYQRIGREITELKQLPERPAGMRSMPTGRTVADDWHAAPDDAARRELLSSYDVRVTLFPISAPDRWTMTGAEVRDLDPIE